MLRSTASPIFLRALVVRIEDAESAEVAREALEEFDEVWGKQYPSIAQAWRRARDLYREAGIDEGVSEAEEHLRSPPA